MLGEVSSISNLEVRAGGGGVGGERSSVKDFNLYWAPKLKSPIQCGTKSEIQSQALLLSYDTE